MAAIDLTDRKSLKSLVNAERCAFAAEKGLKSTPQKLDNHVASLVSSLEGAGVEIDDAELKGKLRGALDAAAGANFVNAGAVIKELDQWIAPMRPAPEPEAEEGEGEEGGE